MAIKKTTARKAAKKSVAKRATSSVKKTAKKVTRGGKSLVKRATSTVSKVARTTKNVAQGAQKAGKVIAAIGAVVETGGKAAEELTTKVVSGGRGALAKAKSSAKKSTAKKSAARKKR
jgi:hypothetical protein